MATNPTPTQGFDPKGGTHTDLMIGFTAMGLGASHLSLGDATLLTCAALDKRIGYARAQVMSPPTELNHENAAVQSNFDFLNATLNSSKNSNTDLQIKDKAKEVMENIKDPYTKITSAVRAFQEEREKLISELNKVIPGLREKIAALLKNTKAGQPKNEAEIKKLRNEVDALTNNVNKHLESRKAVESTLTTMHLQMTTLMKARQLGTATEAPTKSAQVTPSLSSNRPE